LLERATGRYRDILANQKALGVLGCYYRDTKKIKKNLAALSPAWESDAVKVKQPYIQPI
jgi:hypothetical protein